MKSRNVRMRMGALTCGSAVASLILLAVAPGDSQAGIFRDTMAKLGLSKPAPDSAAAAAQGLPRHGFACCNLHYKKDTIDDGNYAELPMIPAGTPIDVTSYGRQKAYITIDGKPMRLGHEYGRDQEALEVWVNKVVINEDPRPRIATWSKVVKDAIYEGKVVSGMTREQVIASVGYPQTNENVTLDQPVWRMWRASGDEYQLHFKQDGHLGQITGEEKVTSLIIFRPEK